MGSLLKQFNKCIDHILSTFSEDPVPVDSLYVYAPDENVVDGLFALNSIYDEDARVSIF